MRKLFFDRKGNTLAYVMMMMVVVFIVVSAVVSLTQSNIKQAGAQENGLQAYYVARSGAELAYQAIMTTSLLNQFISTPTTVLTQNNVDFEVGTADIKAISTPTGTTPQSITITSVGKLKNSNASKTVTLQFYTNYTSYPDIVWSN
jgi:hypothetical protein